MRLTDLAAWLNVRYEVIRDWERGDTRPTYDEMTRLAEILACNIGELMMDVPQPAGKVRRTKKPPCRERQRGQEGEA